jgi:hypothetical protein
LLVLQLDLAFIIFSSGIYKLKAGFAQNEGMEFGLVNPEWGYWWSFYKKLPANHWIFKVYNQLAWSSQLASAFLMLFPPTRFWGGLLLMMSFIVISANIRLAFLSLMMMAAALLFFGPGETPIGRTSGQFSFSDPLIRQWISVPLNVFLQAGLTLYLALLPLAHAGLFYNFYGRKTLPAFWQKALERYTNFFGMIVWRVFSIDVINFFIRIYRAPKGTGIPRTLVSEWENGACSRYRHVAESITVTTLFTTLKYYPSNSKIFEERLLRYARTVPCKKDDILIFEYVSVLKVKDRFEFQTPAEFAVDPDKHTVKEKVLNPQFSIKAIPKVSPVHEGAVPGSYRPPV